MALCNISSLLHFFAVALSSLLHFISQSSNSRPNTLHGVLALSMQDSPPEFAFDLMGELPTPSDPALYLDPALLLDPDASLSRQAHGIHMLLAGDDRFYVGKTRRTFHQRWEEHRIHGVNHKVREF